jgi:hypothetical protein
MVHLSVTVLSEQGDGDGIVRENEPLGLFHPIIVFGLTKMG